MRPAIAIAISLALASVASAGTLTGKVVKIVDGDTIDVLDGLNAVHRVRLHGVDAPKGIRLGAVRRPLRMNGHLDPAEYAPRHIFHVGDEVHQVHHSLQVWRNLARLALVHKHKCQPFLNQVIERFVTLPVFPKADNTPSQGSFIASVRNEFVCVR